MVKLDVSVAADWDRVVSAILAKHGRIDVLVNNAGIVACYEPIHGTDLESWNRVLAVNLTGSFLGMQAVLPAMRKAGKGSIINFSSIWGNVGVPGAAAYNAAKGGVRNMTKNAAVTYAPENIRVNSVHPGLIRTPLVDGAGRRNEQRNHRSNTHGPDGYTGGGGPRLPISCQR